MIEAVEAGVLGYMIRESPLSEIEEGALSVAGGTAIIPPFMLRSLLHHVVASRRVEWAAAMHLESLTPRESEVFELAAMRLNHDDVGDRLFISPATARTHLHRIFKKLEIHSKAELVALAASCGLPTSEETGPPFHRRAARAEWERHGCAGKVRRPPPTTLLPKRSIA